MGHLQSIYNTLKSGGLTEAAALAMMGNWKCESGLEANRLENDFDPYRSNSKAYVTRATSGSMSKDEFKRAVGFGLAQWTYPARKANLWDFWKKSGLALDDPVMQTKFCLWELMNVTEYTDLLRSLRTKTDIYTLVKQICVIYEKPATQNIDDRFRAAQELKERLKENQNGSKNGEGETQMTEVQAINKVVELAKSELGYHEKASNANLDSKTANSGTGNFTKYALDLDQTSAFYNGPKNGFAWCDVFVDWLFVKSFGADTGRQMLCQPLNSAGAGCLYSAQYYKQAGQWTTSPRVGDQIFFSYSPGEYSHTGIVISVVNKTVTTIEGNSSDQVAQRSYQLGAGNIAGYGRPKWELAISVQETTYVPISSTTTQTASSTGYIPILKKGSKGKYVEDLQKSLLKLGYDVGSYGADGDFGNDTRDAVVRFQEDHNLLKDGEVGPNTYEAITNALLKLTVAKYDGDQTVIVGAPEPVVNDDRIYLSIGEIIEFSGDTCYISFANDSLPTKCKSGKALIINVNKNGKHPYQLCKINIYGSTVYGWVDYDDVQKVS